MRNNNVNKNAHQTLDFCEMTIEMRFFFHENALIITICRRTRWETYGIHCETQWMESRHTHKTTQHFQLNSQLICLSVGRSVGLFSILILLKSRNKITRTMVASVVVVVNYIPNSLIRMYHFVWHLCVVYFICSVFYLVSVRPFRFVLS